MRLRYRPETDSFNDVEKGDRSPTWRDWTKRKLAGRGNAAADPRMKQGLAWLVYGIFTIVVLIEHTPWFPAFLVRLATGSGLLYLCYRVYTFPRWDDENRYVVKFAACFFAMIVELLWENCMVWAVSATDLRKYNNVPGLQDNVEVVLDWMVSNSRIAKAVLTFQWADIKHLLGATLALPFASIFDQTPYSGFGMMTRVVVTIALSRILRVASFLSTVLPSPRPGCYQTRFPPVPHSIAGFLKVGFVTVRGFGGCNDLVFSGHGVIWTLAPLVFQAYYPGKVTWILWLAVAHRSLHDVLDKQHYSVDMVLAVAVTWLVWHALEWMYPPADKLPPRLPGAPPDRPNVFVLALICFCLFAVSVIVFIGKA